MERDPDTRVDGKPAVLPGEHVGGRVRIEKPLPLEESDHAAADPFGERGEVALGERPSGQERRRPVGGVRSRQEDAVGDGRVQMGVAVEPRAEAVEEGDGADWWAGGWQRGLLIAAEALQTQQRLDLRREKSWSPPRRPWAGRRALPAAVWAVKSPTAARARAG